MAISKLAISTYSSQIPHWYRDHFRRISHMTLQNLFSNYLNFSVCQAFCWQVLAGQPPLISQILRRGLRVQAVVMLVLGFRNQPPLALQAKQRHLLTSTSDDEREGEYSIASELPYEGQGNSAPDGAVSPNPVNEVSNPTPQSNGKRIVKEEARSIIVNLND